MALSEDTLADELLGAFDEVAGGEPGAARIAAAYAEYFKGATLNGVTVSAAAVAGTAANAMAAALTFNSGLSRAAGAAVLHGGVAAFWGAIAASASTFWPGATTVTPPAALTSLTADLIAAFGANMTAEAEDAAANLAAALHTGSQGATGVVAATTYPIL